MCTVNPNALALRISQYKWPVEKAITHPQKDSTKKHNIVICAFNEEKTLREWAKDARCVVHYMMLKRRIFTDNWEVEKALTHPEERTSITAFSETKSIKEWSRDNRCVVAYSTLYNRIHKYHWEPEAALTTHIKQKGN